VSAGQKPPDWECQLPFRTASKEDQTESLSNVGTPSICKHMVCYFNCIWADGDPVIGCRCLALFFFHAPCVVAVPDKPRYRKGRVRERCPAFSSASAFSRKDGMFEITNLRKKENEKPLD
jgi:hypothetical protein